MTLERLHNNEIINNMSLERKFVRDQLVQHIYIHEDEKNEATIPGLGKNKILFESNIIETISDDVKNGCRNFILFFVPKTKSNNQFITSFQENILLKI